MTAKTDTSEQIKLMADDLAGVIAGIRRQLRRTAGPPFPGGPLTGAQIDLVRHVRQHPGGSVADAAADLRVAPNTVSTLVRQLSDLGILTRTPDSLDRRVARLDLTRSARARLHRWRGERNQLIADALAHIPPDDRSALARALPVLERLATTMADRAEAER